MAQHFLVEASSSDTPQHDFHTHAHAEYDALCSTIERRLRDGSLPPNEAYWWARIICGEALTRLSQRCVAGRRDPIASATDSCGAAA